MGGEGEPEQLFVQPEDLPERSDVVGVKGEHEERIVAVAVLLDGVGEPALAPTIDGRDSTAVLSDPLLDPIEGGAQPLLVEVRPKHGNNLVSAHLARSLPLD
jgi:hypothetical protein